MRFTRRLLDRSLTRATVIASLFAAGGAAASCSSIVEDDGGVGPIDAAPDALGASADTGVDASAPKDAGPIDAAPLPILCTSPPCAKVLVTTRGIDADDLAEGFCALLTDGTVACWGSNGGGQLGRADEAGAVDSANPERVVGLTDVVDLDHTCAIDKNGATWCWGTGPFLRDGLGAATTERTPIKLPIGPATKIGIGLRVGCAATPEGLQCWGSNHAAQLGPRDLALSGRTFPPRAIALPAGAAIHRIAVGAATLVVREDGAMVSWGGNPGVGRVSSLFPDPYPTKIGVGGVATIDEAFDNVCVTAGGAGYCWGEPVPKPSGETAGAAPGIDRALPEPIVSPEPIVQIATTRSRVRYSLNDLIVQPYRWCATAISGAVYCWGFNDSGQAGNGKKDYAFDAVRVVGLPERAAEVRATHSATCALLTNGKVFCWGNNFYGQLGNGKARGETLVPEEVVLP